MHWIVRNGRWLDSINSQLPEFVTVASMQIYEDCNFEKVQEHLKGPLWRVLLLDGSTNTPLTIKMNGYEVVIPLEASDERQDCKMKEEEVCKPRACTGTVSRAVLGQLLEPKRYD